MELGIGAAFTIFGEDHACHKWSGTRWERSFNRAIFDVQVGALANPVAREGSMGKSELLVERFKKLCVEDAEFSQAVSTTTKSLDATRERFTKWFKAVGDITGETVPLPTCLEPSQG